MFCIFPQSKHSVFGNKMFAYEGYFIRWAPLSMYTNDRKRQIFLSMHLLLRMKPLTLWFHCHSYGPMSGFDLVYFFYANHLKFYCGTFRQVRGSKWKHLNLFIGMTAKQSHGLSGVKYVFHYVSDRNWFLRPKPEPNFRSDTYFITKIDTYLPNSNTGTVARYKSSSSACIAYTR